MPSDDGRNAWYNLVRVALPIVLVVGFAVAGRFVAAAVWFGLAAINTVPSAVDFRRASTRLELDPDGVTLVNTFRTHRFRWAEIRGIDVEPAVGVRLLTAEGPVRCDALRARWFGWQRDPRNNAECVLTMNNAAAWLETTRIHYAVEAAGQG